MRKLALPVTLAALLVLGLSPAAQAAQPIILDIPAVEFDDPFVCGGDPVIHVSYTKPFKIMLYLAGDGSIERDATFGPGSRVVLTDASTGRSLSSTSPAIFRTRYADDGSIESLTVNGLSAAITLPGHGTILLDTGTISWSDGFLGTTIKATAPHEWLGGDDNEAFCDYYRS